MGSVGELLERAAYATPAAVEDRQTGWWLRYTDTAAWWSGAVLAHGRHAGLAVRIDAAERFYVQRSALVRFQVCPDCPSGLDEELEERGYQQVSPVALLTTAATALAGTQVRPGLTVRVEGSPGAHWLDVLGATSAPGTDLEHETRLLHRVDPPRAYVTALGEGRPVGIGRAVASGGWTGTFGMATVPAARRRGVGRLVLSAIASWAVEQDAPRLYLQVEQSNDAARRLYAAAGFTRLATYHYRVGPYDLR